MTKRIKSYPARLAISALIILQYACDGQTNGGDSAEDDATPNVPVEIAQPTRSDIYATYSGTAPIEAFADVTVIAKVGGEIRNLMVEEGDEVTAGQVLARLDGDRLRLEVEQARANLHKLQRDYQRNVDLKDRSLISDGDFEKIRYEMDALQATFDLASLELNYTEIRAPINGVVSERFVKLGNTIEPNEQVFKVTSLDPLVSYLHIPEKEYRRIVAGQAVSIAIDALPDTLFEGIVARISPVIDPDTGTFKITIEVSDTSRRLKPGMFGRISITHDKHLAALQIPRSAIVDEATVFVVEKGVAVKRTVETGLSSRGNVEILSGLQDGDSVIVVGQTSLKDGTGVSIVGQPSDTAPVNISQAGQL